MGEMGLIYYGKLLSRLGGRVASLLAGEFGYNIVSAPDDEPETMARDLKMYQIMNLQKKWKSQLAELERGFILGSYP